jgi:hypothetical protein
MSLDVKATSAMSPHESPARAVRVGCTPSGNELPDDFRDLLLELADAAALLKNKRAAGRAQDIADVEAIAPKAD